ncbi:MAG: redoxin family protein [Fimbriimonadaceae bacterium]|nr:redoxin family protein [Fimbriimonadaceae bacterium]
MNTIISLIAISLGLFAQDTPQTIAKKDLPAKAECVVCNAGGETHGEEKPVAGVMYKGKAYYFCNAKEVETFKKNPDFYMPLNLPMPLPDLKLTDTSGKKWDAAAFKGKVVLLDYWATWCKPCLVLKPKIDKIWEANKGQGFEMLSVSIDEKPADFENFFKKTKWENPVALDSSQSWAHFRILTIPTLVLVKDGKVIQIFKGNIDPKKVETAVKSALK